MQNKNKKPPKEYRVIVLQNSMVKKKIEYQNKEKFLKFLRLEISNHNVLKVEHNEIEIPAESTATVKIQISAGKNCEASIDFIRYDTDEIEEELLFKITVK